MTARVPDESRVLAVMSPTRRAGPWSAPRTLHVWALMSEAVVDLRDAVLPTEGCDVEVGALMGSPRDLTRAGPGGARAPHVRVTGSCVMAEVKVLQGAAADLKALELDD